MLIGHRYGSNHPAMAAKLQQLDLVIKVRSLSLSHHIASHLISSQTKNTQFGNQSGIRY
jgi:hypothetical protein